PSPVEGKIVKLDHEEGDVVKVGEVLAVIEEDVAEKAPIKEPVTEEPAEEELVKEEESASVVGELPISKATAKNEVNGVLAVPTVRRLARSMGIDLSQVKGTGPDGRIMEEDVRSLSTTEKPITSKLRPKFDLYGEVDRIPLKGIRKTIARNMIEAQTTSAQVTVMDVADVTDLVALRETVKERAMSERGVRVTYLPFIIKAVVAALKKYPYLNSELDEETQDILLKKYYNLGIAVATEEGLMVPVIKGADNKDIYALAKELSDLSEHARSRRIDLADLKGGTFTITNYGVFGGTFATPIINPPEAAILGTGRITDQPTVHSGEIVIRKILHLSLTFDHRILDGAEAGSFLSYLIEMLENPALALMES
ncbi:MAG: 2-oxo acid dehydrogenase subunit E2, partial [Euryarchaeota archaeon]|nr:2-oxo acid dehydrogenase subunit E2 [Euryarchaeota archaeon]